MKVGTDGVLLGAWADITGARRILDVGAGCGLISAMLHQRILSRSEIVAVDIDSGAIEDCRFNFESLKNDDDIRLIIIEGDFRSVIGDFDLIVSNPPFFKGDLEAAGKSRFLARQGNGLDYNTLIKYSKEHLSDKGHLVFISDIRYENDIHFHAEFFELKLLKKCQVHTKSGKSAKRILWDFVKYEVKSPEISKITLYDSDGNRHSEYVKLTKDYYLD